MSKIADRLKHVRDNINAACLKAGRDPAEVRLVVVTKSVGIEAIEEVIRLGCVDLGENRVQQLKKVAAQVDEFLAKGSPDENLPKKINWHMIGHLQRNKVKQVLSLITLVHSVDTLRLAEEISTEAARENLCTPVLMQINTSMEPQKFGVPVGAAIHLAEQIVTLPSLKLTGLMTMAPLTKDSSVIRECFVRARELFAELKGEGIVDRQFAELSMGMSSDYEIAIEEGATLLRIGSAVFAG
jgi:PLP dependent protein